LRARYNAAPALCGTLEQLVENEKGEKKRTATEGLMWQIRALSFTCKALQSLQANKTEEMSVAFSKSYEGTLKKFHNFVVKGVFAVCDEFLIIFVLVLIFERRSELLTLNYHRLR
jgi:Glycolipid transfer protein (GLTP)